ncbi:MAG: hypothetical protein AB1831_03855 [Pseudomonadota bacterium]
MLLDTLESQGLFFNSNFTEPAAPGLFAYRGDLVLIEGEVADNLGRRKPPVATMIGAVVLADATQIKFLSGSLDEIAHIQPFLEKYAAHFSPTMGALLYVVNIKKPMQVKLAGTTFVLLPLDDGMVWNELMDELHLEKGDFKGQGSGEKVYTVYKAYQDYRPKCEEVSLEEALSRATDAKRVVHGAV